jgi:hypothetical protein
MVASGIMRRVDQFLLFPGGTFFLKYQYWLTKDDVGGD